MRSVAAFLIVLFAGCGDADGSGASSSSSGGGAAGGGGSSGTLDGGAGGTGAAGAGGADGGSGGAGAVGGSGAGGATGGGGTGGTGGADAGYGFISGACGVIDEDDVFSPTPELIQNLIDFTTFPALQTSDLTPGGQAIFADGNLGGSSLYSEIFAFEVLTRCDNAEYLKSEAEIVYAINGKKTDLLIAIDGHKIGVSVVRAVSFPEGSPYPVSQAYTVLEGKLADILQSTMNVAPEDAWEKQFLAVVAQTPAHADAITQAYDMVDPATKADTVVIITTTEGEDDFIYYNN